jgi:hypothetical protein
VATVLVGRAALGTGAPSAGAILLGVLSVALWLGLVLLTGLRIRALETFRTPVPPPLPPAYAVATTLCALALAACAVALVL